MSAAETTIDNRRTWDARVPIHLRSRMYGEQIDRLRAGGHTLDPIVLEELGSVAGKRVVHLQCHIGLDSLSLSRLRAEVVGVDFSEPAIAAARAMAEELGLGARFVVAEVLAAPRVLRQETFDLVFATYGVLCWIGDLRGWMRAAATLLRPGGELYLRDGHPFADLLEDGATDPAKLELEHDYFHRGPHPQEPGPTYTDDRDGRIVPATVEWTHTLGDIVTAAADAGLRVRFLHEHPNAFFRKFKAMAPGDAGQWRLPGRLRDRLPMTYSLMATR